MSLQQLSIVSSLPPPPVWQAVADIKIVHLKLQMKRFVTVKFKDTDKIME
jgi:hypothetical protein